MLFCSLLLTPQGKQRQIHTDRRLVMGTTSIVGDAGNLLDLLPRTTVREYKKRGLVYRGYNESLYLVIEGCVWVSRRTESGKEVVLNSHHKNDLFGETSFFCQDHPGEEAVAVQNTKVMFWTQRELKPLMLQSSHIGFNLLRRLARKLEDQNLRIMSLAVDPICSRLAKTLIFLASAGSKDPDGVVNIVLPSHEGLAKYVGTSREIVTTWMNTLRKQNALEYRRGSAVISIDALKRFINKR